MSNKTLKEINLGGYFFKNNIFEFQCFKNINYGKKASISYCIINLDYFFILCQPKTALEVLSRITIIDSLKPIENDTLFQSTYEVWFRIPLDHNNPNSSTFPLRAYYSHKDFNKPMVVVIDGYTIYTSRANELT